MESTQGRNPKVYVAVVAQFDEDGTVRPLEVTWEDGRRFEIDRITDVRQAPALKAGSGGVRYTIRINGQHSYLFFERNITDRYGVVGQWFVERKGS